METPTIDRMIGEHWTAHKSMRGRLEREHRHIARYIRPQQAEFFNDGTQPDPRPAIEILWDDTAIDACDTWARGVNSMTHNQATDWFTLGDKETIEGLGADVLSWHADVNKDLKKQLRQGGFYLAALNRLKDVGAYGFGALYSYQDDNRGHLAFEYVPAVECYFDLNRQGLCRKFIRPLNLTYVQIEERGIEITRCSQPIQDAKARADQSTKFLILHYVIARDSLPQEVDSNHDFVGFYYEVTVSKIVQQHGFHDMPYHVLCWEPMPQSPYCVGIGFITLPEIRNLNAQRKKFDRILDNESDSPILTSSQDEGKEQSRPQAGEMIYNGMSGEGRRLYDPLYQGNSGTRSLREEIMDSRNAVLEAFHNNLMLMLSNAQMTATEVASRDEKIIQAMGPFIIPMMGDLQQIIDRVFHARARAGHYDPFPEALGSVEELELELHGILAKAHKKLVANQITMFYGEALATIGQTPGGQQEIDALDHREALEHLGEARALPVGIVPSKTQREEQVAAQQQAQAAAMAAEQAPGMAKAARDAVGAMNEMEQGGGGGVALSP